MGMLDEAIREHLELKKRRGVDPQEVARQEADALGPAVRETVPQSAQQQPAPDAGLEAHEPAPGIAEPATEIAQPATEAFEPAHAGEAVPDLPDDELEDEAVTASPAPAAPPPDLQDDDLDFFADDEPAPQPADAEEEEDVLEETPDFLQETPEHDRLWFEQKPPRDFDFEGQ